MNFSLNPKRIAVNFAALVAVAFGAYNGGGLGYFLLLVAAVLFEVSRGID